MRNFEKEIQDKTNEADKIIEKLKREIADIAEEGRTTAYWGEYGVDGQTFYSEGYIEDNKDSDEIQWLFNNYHFDPSTWISSSETC